MFYRVLVIFVIIALTVVYSAYQKKQLESQIVSDNKSSSVLAKLPSATFQTLEGVPVNLHELYKREKIDLLVVHFWGTWCAPCEAELPDLLALMKRFEGRPNVKFLLVAVNDEEVKVRKHLKSMPVPKANVQWLIDNQNMYRNEFGTIRVPETYIFASDMTTLRKYTGPQEWNKPLFFQTFDEFIQISTRKL